MLKTIKLRLHPSQEQEKLFHEFSGCSKFVYNYVIRKQLENREAGNSFINYYDFKKEFTGVKREFPFLLECSNQTLDGAMRDAFTAYTRFFKETSAYPKYRSRYEKKFYIRYDKFKAGINLDIVGDKITITRALKGKSVGYDLSKRVYLEKIGWVKVSEPERLKGFYKFQNPRVKFDGLHWNLTVVVEVAQDLPELTDEVLGVDLGVKELAISSNNQRYINVNKSKKMKKLEKRKKRLQRQSARKYQATRVKGSVIKKGEKFQKSNNQKKLEKKIAKISRKQASIRHTHTCQVISDLVKTHPKLVVLENLNVKGMMKNKKLARVIQEQGFGKFGKQMEWKCLQLGIGYLEADRYYPSSKLCNCCGVKKVDLKLSDRVFVCPECGYVEDRDFNAALNLEDYGKDYLLQSA